MSVSWSCQQEMQKALVADGWFTPDTYSNCFEPISDISAVYLFLVIDQPMYQRGFVAYVGMSKRLEQRLAGHSVLSESRRTGHWPMRWFKPTRRADLRIVEREYIARFDPPWNIIGRKRGVKLQ